MVNNTVSEVFAKASVASAFLPRYGPLPGSAENVRKEKIRAVDKKTIKVTDDATLKLFNLRVFVELSSEQVADDALSSAQLAFRRAANTLAQAEDDIVFNGYQSAAAPAEGTAGGSQAAPGVTSFASNFVASEHPEKSKGLSEPSVPAGINRTVSKSPPDASDGVLTGSAGQEIVTAVVQAIGDLE
ncbi:MAG: encapsulin, partial [Thermoanaerobaculia bacterium]